MRYKRKASPLYKLSRLYTSSLGEVIPQAVLEVAAFAKKYK